MQIADGEYLTRRKLSQYVVPVRVRRFDQREARDDMRRFADMLPAKRIGEMLKVAFRLLDSHDVRSGALYRFDDLAEIDGIAAKPDIEGHH